jgi:23S rRNA (pseudouridine1915-N3)-methyltransferase
VKIQILQIAKTKDSNLAALEAEYEKRLRPFATLENVTLPASKKDEREAVQKEERESFLTKLDRDSHIIALDERGTQLTTEAFTELLRKNRDHGPGRVQFLIGGSHGLHPDVLAAAHQRLSLSKMTFTHEMVRVFLKEQVYRAFTILAGKKYHK